MSDKTKWTDNDERMAVIKTLLGTCERIERASDQETVVLQSMIYRALLNKLNKLGDPDMPTRADDGHGDENEDEDTGEDRHGVFRFSYTSRKGKTYTLARALVTAEGDDFMTLEPTVNPGLAGAQAVIAGKCHAALFGFDHAISDKIFKPRSAKTDDRLTIWPEMR